MLAVMLRRRMAEVGMDTGGVEPWAYHTVGGVQLATHSWMSNPRMSSDELIDYLTMLSWNALCGIVEVGGSLEKFRRSRIRRRFCRRNCLTDRMSDNADLPSLWTHEPHIDLSSARATRSATSTPTRRPGFKRQQGRRADAAGRAQRPVRRAAGDALRQQPVAGDTRSVLLVLQGMDTAGKGGIVKHVVGAGNPQGIRYTSFGKPTEEELRAPLPVADPQCAADRPATSACSTARTTRTC